MPDVRCINCDEPMHRFGYPADADKHTPSSTACLNTLRGALDDALDLIQRLADNGNAECQEHMRLRRKSGQGMRYPDRWTPRTVYDNA